MVMGYDPFADLIPIRQLLDRLFDISVVRPSSLFGAVGGAEVPFDLYETDQDVVVTAALPGIDQQSLELAFNHGVLTVKGQRTAPGEEQQGWTWHMRGLSHGTFQFAVTLPTQVDPEKAEAQYENGLVTIRLPKAEEVKPKKIAIRSAPRREVLPAGAR